MRVLIGALLLSLGAWQTHHRAQDWRSDEALWTAARRTAPGVARPALNLGVVYVRQARWSEATAQFLQAARLSDGTTRRQAGLGLGFIDTVGAPICDQPQLSSWCVWLSP